MNSYSEFKVDFISNMNAFLHDNWINVPENFLEKISIVIDDSIKNTLLLTPSSILSLFPKINLKDHYESEIEQIEAIKSFSNQMQLENYIKKTYSAEMVNQHYDSAIRQSKKIIENCYPETITKMRSVKNISQFNGFKSLGLNAGMFIPQLSDWISYKSIITHEESQHVSHVIQLISAITSYKIAAYSDIQFNKIKQHYENNTILKNKVGIQELISICLKD